MPQFNRAGLMKVGDELIWVRSYKEDGWLLELNNGAMAPLQRARCLECRRCRRKKFDKKNTVIKSTLNFFRRFRGVIKTWPR